MKRVPLREVSSPGRARRSRPRPRDGRRRRSRPGGSAGVRMPTPRRSLDTPIYVDHRLPSHDGGSIYVVEAGEGPPIVLSHGVTLSVRTWFHQLELLPKEGFRAIAFDHRGHGESVLGDAGHSLENLAEDVRSVLLGLDLRDAVLVGHSHGRRCSAELRDPLSRARGGAGARHRLALHAREDAVRFALDADEIAHGTHVQPRARLEVLVGTQEPRVPRRALGVRKGSAPEPRRVGAPHDARVRTGHAPRRAAGARRTRPHGRPARDPDPDTRRRRHRRSADPSWLRKADGGPDSRARTSSSFPTAATC